MGLGLETIVIPPPPQDNVPQILRQVDYKDNTQKFRQKTGLITEGFLDVTYTSAGISWGISDLITFSYEYTKRPIFTAGLEGSYSGDTTNTSPDVNYYFPNLPTKLEEYIEANDYTTFSPAIFVPRIIHWYRRSELVYSGCFILVAQLNPDCTEIIGKTCRLHFKFEGEGYLSNTLGA